ncbi:MAG: PKD domain-containing protein [Candidatus Hydrogenedentes bacterium]|nr:PKD domain-containing protein [Candidatus Hydrogenedentota bacterium]
MLSTPWSTGPRKFKSICCCALSAIAAALAIESCGSSPDQLLIATPTVIEFGSDKLNDSVDVAAPVRGAKLSIRAIAKVAWLNIAPEQVFSDGPDSPARIRLSITRAQMKPGHNTCKVVLRAPGYADTLVHVGADAYVSADFRVSQSNARPGELVLFNDATRVLTGAQPISAWRWDFGDGATSTEQNPVHVYEDPGVYTVALAVTSASGSDVRIQPNCVTVKKAAVPEADFVAATRRPASGTAVQFSDLSLPGSSGITQWLWDFGDRSWSAEQHPLHVYKASAVYDVYLTVSNANGSNTAVKLGYIDVQPAKVQNGPSTAIP